MQIERTMADLYMDLDVKTYKLRRWHNGRLMASGAEVRASNDAEAIEKARALFYEPEYRNDKFEIEAVE